MFYRDEKKTHGGGRRPLSELTAIKSADVLLSQHKRATCLKHIQQHSELSTTQFENLGMPLLQNVAYYSQNLPDTFNTYYTQPGGLLDMNLNRTDAALSLLRAYWVQNHETPATEAQQAWIYALFSASLLQGLGKLPLDYCIELFPSEEIWHPLLGAFPKNCTHYHYQLLKQEDSDTRRRLNILIACQLMPTAGFDWIASKREILAVWLALLNEDERSAGTLGAVLERAKIVAWHRAFDLFIDEHTTIATPRTKHPSTFIDTSPPKLSQEQEQLLGLEFVAWIMKTMADGTLLINQFPYFMLVPGGLLMSMEIFKRFAAQHPKYKHWQTVQHAFLTLDLHQVSPQGHLVSRFELNKKMMSGLLVQAAILPDTVHVYDPETHQSHEVSALELMHRADAKIPLAQLSPTGTWQQAEKQAPFMQPGIKQHGL